MIIQLNSKRLIPALLATSLSLSAQAQDWSRGAVIPPNGRSNPYQVPETDLPKVIRAGKLHALHYPVTVTGIQLPYRPIANFVSSNTSNPLRYILEQFISQLSGYQSMDDVEAWMGMQSYPRTQGAGVYEVPFLNGRRPVDRMGLTRFHYPQAVAFSISCAQCHAANLFGRRVMGMTNRFPRANAVFVRAKEIAPHIPREIFQLSTGATDVETDFFEFSKYNLEYVGAKMPVQLGLDTSLAQVALSLAKRARDPWATRVPHLPERYDPIQDMVSDSKPAVWWNLKYKNRWLSDGSVVAGNPIFTNFIWNEIGRGTDLAALEDWLASNASTVRALTTAVFSSQPPRWTDFFPASSINEAKARRGEQLYNQTCSRCHGTYTKAWSQAGYEKLTALARLETTQVVYPNLVVNVGTDPGRFQGTTSLEQLNDLQISKRNGILIERQNGYMPPPLVGIWARWPYFHNNSVPTLCAVLTRATKRPVAYWAREANDRRKDFDSTCVGYPNTAPDSWDEEYYYDTRRPGMHASGHDQGIFIKDGKEILSRDEKMAIIEYLKTL